MQKFTRAHWFIFMVNMRTDMNLKFMRRISEREWEIRQFGIVKNKLMSIFNASVLFIDNEFCHNIVKVVCGSTRLSPRGSTATLTM